MQDRAAILLEIDRLTAIEDNPDTHQDDQAQAGAARTALEWVLGDRGQEPASAKF